MKKLLKVFLIIGIVILVIIVAFIVITKISKKLPAVPAEYWNATVTGGEIEKKYTVLGEYNTKSVKFDISGKSYSNYTVWYPEELETANKQYPLVIMANGTGVTNNRYEDVFKHLASWGFVVIGNNDESSGNGKSTSESLEYMLNLNSDKDSIFYEKIDEDNIGACGHSQGGVAVIHMAYAFDNSDKIKTIFSASATTDSMIASWKLDTFIYDATKINIPWCMVAATGKTDSETISPLADMKKNFEKAQTTTVMARRSGIDHGEMLYISDGYMTAWFRYYLMNDSEAKKAFFGESPELFNNTNWVDQQSK